MYVQVNFPCAPLIAKFSFSTLSVVCVVYTISIAWAALLSRKNPYFREIKGPEIHENKQASVYAVYTLPRI